MSDSNPGMIESVERVYAAALLDLADQDDRVDDVRQEMDELANLFADQPDLRRLVESRVLSESERSGCIERLFKGNLSDLVYRFLQVVNAKQRMTHLPDIATALGRMVDERRGILDVEAHVARPLNDDDAADLTQRLSTILDAKVRLHSQVDEHLIGGLKLRIEDRLLDGSVATQLKRMQHRLAAAGRRGRGRGDQGAWNGEE